MNASDPKGPDEIAFAAVELREATATDDAFLHDLYARVRAPELVAVPWTEAEKRLFCDRQYTLQDRHYRDNFAGARCLVVSAGQVPIGRLYRATIRRTLYLLDISLLPEARRRGVGTMLIRDLVAEADRESLTVVLHVEPDNAARRLYARFGFVEASQDGIYLEMKRAPGGGCA